MSRGGNGKFFIFESLLLLFLWKKQKELEHKTENNYFFLDRLLEQRQIETSSSPPRPIWLRCWQDFIGTVRSLGSGVAGGQPGIVLAKEPPGSPVLVLWPGKPGQ